MTSTPAAPATALPVDLPSSELAAFNTFLALSSADVEDLALRSLRTSAGTTWVGLSNMMQRQGYARVSDLDFPAALSWARHLGLIGGPRRGLPLRRSENTG